MRFVFYEKEERKKSYRYRKYDITRYKGGWIFDDDNNIYVSIDSACNAIDAKLGGIGRRGVNAHRQDKGIKIIGQRE